jgi:hypothetical protein
MTTITFQGTEREIRTINDNLGIWQNELEVETRVFVVDVHSLVNKYHSSLTDEEFMDLAESQGTVCTLKCFQEDYNIGKYEMHYVIRFINIPIS